MGSRPSRTTFEPFLFETWVVASVLTIVGCSSYRASRLTLPLRMERHCDNTQKVAEFLSGQPKVEWVRYPGLVGDSEFEKKQKYL